MKYIHFQLDMAPCQHVSHLINRDLEENPTWELAAVYTLPHAMESPTKKIVNIDGKSEPKMQVVQMACPIYRVLEKDRDTMPKVPQGVDDKGNMLIGVDNPLPPKTS